MSEDLDRPEASGPRGGSQENPADDAQVSRRDLFKSGGTLAAGAGAGALLGATGAEAAAPKPMPRSTPLPKLVGLRDSERAVLTPAARDVSKAALLSLIANKPNKEASKLTVRDLNSMTALFRGRATHGTVGGDTATTGGGCCCCCIACCCCCCAVSCDSGSCESEQAVHPA